MVMILVLFIIINHIQSATKCQRTYFHHRLRPFR
jgi:hypothetical protein